MVLQPTPVKRLLAEQLAVPSPQLSCLLASLPAAPPPPTADFTRTSDGFISLNPSASLLERGGGGASDDM